MNILKIALCGAAASLAMAGAASAQVSFNAGASSEYVFRGLSQGSGAQGFGGVDWASDNFYVGAWTSNVGFGPSAEVDLYAGYTPSFAGVDWNLSATYYAYVNDDNTYVNYKTGLQDAAIDSAYTEFGVAGTVPAGPASFTGKVIYSPDFFAEAGDALYYEAGFSVPYNDVTISGAVGMQTVDETEAGFDDDYTTWNLGFTIPVNDHFSADLRYINSSSKADNFANTNLSGVAFDGIVATLKATY